jgi:predicted nucleotidyltransferase
VDLSEPLRTIAPGLDSAVLQVLAGTESGLSASQIARLTARGSRVGQVPVLNRLVEHGLVSAQPANHGYLYSLNRDHVLAEPVMAAARARTTIVARLVAALGSLRPEPLHVSLFGSFARGQGDADSDIDLLVIPCPDADLGDEWNDQLDALAAKVYAWTGNRLEHVVLTRDRLRAAFKAGEPIVASWLEEGQTVLGAPLEPLAQEATGSARSRNRR